MLCTTLAIKYPLAFDRLVNGSDYDGMKSTLLAELRRRNKSINQFEKRLRRKWNDPLELFGGLILLCEIMAESNNYELNRKGRKIDVKYIALRKIHGRALKVSNEIFTLLKGGYPDGAHSLWRTLYELEIISHFLVNQDLDVSERYMAHTDMRRYKEAKDYQTYCKKINYEPLTEDELLTMKRRVEDLITKYGTEFCYEKGFEWIPKAILRSRSFRNLEEAVGFSHYHPYYNWSSDSIHGGPKGLISLGTLNGFQSETILIGPSNYGLVDPMHATALSLLRITLNLLSQNQQSRNQRLVNFSLKLVDEVGEKALKIQIDIEKYESNRSNRQSNSPSIPPGKF